MIKSSSTQNPNPKKSLILPQTLQKLPVSSYTKLQIQGSGNYGQVFKAVQKQSNKIVALKKVKRIQNKDEGLSVSFIREISILRKLNHPNIVKVLGYCVEDDQGRDGYVVMEFVGGDLEREIGKGKLGLEKTKNIIKKVLQAVAYCHKNHIIHRDLKPSNILLSPQSPQPKLADFGIAKQVHLNPKCNTTQISALYYRAPQLLLQNQSLSTYSIDIWAIGCIFAECLLGRIAFQAELVTELAQLRAILEVMGIQGDWKIVAIREGMDGLRNRLRNVGQRPVQEFWGKLGQILDQAGLDLINKLLCFHPEKRITAQQALDHQFFKQKEIKNAIQPQRESQTPQSTEQPQKI